MLWKNMDVSDIAVLSCLVRVRACVCSCVCAQISKGKSRLERAAQSSSSIICFLYACFAPSSVRVEELTGQGRVKALWRAQRGFNPLINLRLREGGNVGDVCKQEGRVLHLQAAFSRHWLIVIRKCAKRTVPLFTATLFTKTK